MLYQVIGVSRRCSLVWYFKRQCHEILLTSAPNNNCNIYKCRRTCVNVETVLRYRIAIGSYRCNCEAKKRSS
jgi:hypothetical protein